jgi:hypothetical protein
MVIETAASPPNESIANKELRKAKKAAMEFLSSELSFLLAQSQTCFAVQNDALVKPPDNQQIILPDKIKNEVTSAIRELVQLRISQLTAIFEGTREWEEVQKLFILIQENIAPTKVLGEVRGLSAGAAATQLAANREKLAKVFAAVGDLSLGSDFFDKNNGLFEGSKLTDLFKDIAKKESKQAMLNAASAAEELSLFAAKEGIKVDVTVGTEAYPLISRYASSGFKRPPVIPVTAKEMLVLKDHFKRGENTTADIIISCGLLLKKTGEEVAFLQTYADLKNALLQHTTLKPEFIEELFHKVAENRTAGEIEATDYVFDVIINPCLKQFKDGIAKIKIDPKIKDEFEFGQVLAKYFKFSEMNLRYNIILLQPKIYQDYRTGAQISAIPPAVKSFVAGLKIEDPSVPNRSETNTSNTSKNTLYSDRSSKSKTRIPASILKYFLPRRKNRLPSNFPSSESASHPASNPGTPSLTKLPKPEQPQPAVINPRIPSNDESTFIDRFRYLSPSKTLEEKGLLKIMVGLELNNKQLYDLLLEAVRKYEEKMVEITELYRKLESLEANIEKNPILMNEVSTISLEKRREHYKKLSDNAKEEFMSVCSLVPEFNKKHGPNLS